MQDKNLLFSAPATAKQQKIAYGILLIMWAILAVCYIHYLQPLGFPLDDAYIALHNAQVLHVGYDINYPGTPALDGSTSAIHLALVAFLMFWLAPPYADVIILWLAIFVYAAGVLRLAFCFSASRLQAALLVVAGLLAVDVPLQVLNGLETGLAMAAVTWQIIFLISPSTCCARILRNLLCGLLPFIRPELSLLSLLIIIYYLKHYWQEMNSFKYLIKNIFYDCSWMLLSALPWLLWYQLSTGNFYPETIRAKEYFMAQLHLPWMTKLYFLKYAVANFAGRFSWVGFIGAGILLLVTPTGRLGILFILGFLTAYGIYYPCGLFINALRYFYVIVPWLLYGLISNCRNSDKVIRVGANLLLILVVVQTIFAFPARWNFYLFERNYFNHNLSNLANWCKQHLPPDGVILVHDAGYMAYATPFHLIDMVGLKTPSSIYYHKTMTFPSNGVLRDQAVSRILLHDRPGYLIVFYSWEHKFDTVYNLQQLGWHFTLLWTEKNAYSVYKIDYPHSMSH